VIVKPHDHAHRDPDCGVDWRARLVARSGERFAAVFGSEFYIEPGREPGLVEGWPFADP